MPAKVITFFSLQGGVGKTLISLNTGICLSRENKKVFFLDLNLGAVQPINKLIGVENKYCLFDLIPYLNEFKENKKDLTNYVSTYKHNFLFLPAIFKLPQRKNITSDVIKNIISLASLNSDYVIIDAGNTLSDNLVSILESSHLVLVILTPDIVGVYQTEWFFDTLQSLGFPLTMVKIIINRAESYGSINWQEVKAVLPVEIISLIPSEGKTVNLAINKGVPLVIDSPSSKIASALYKLAQQLIKRNDLYMEHKEFKDIKIKEEELKGEEAFWEKLGILEKLERISLEEEEDALVKFKKRVHERLIEELDLKRIPIEVYSRDSNKIGELKSKAERIVSTIIVQEAEGFISSTEMRKKIIKEIIDEALGLGPIEDLLKDPTVTEVMVNNKDQVYIERYGKLELTTKKFTSNDQVRIVIERILAPLGRRIDESVPYVDARLPDGSRVNAIIPPLSLTGPTLTIRKFSKERYTMDDLIKRFNSLTPDMALFLDAAVKTRKNILISGGTGSGKTTFLNILSSYIPANERIITIEDAAELKLFQPHWIRLEARPPNIEGRGEITIRDLFRNTLRMRPDRIIVGEVRGKEVLDMLQAMNTGHDGSMSTIHANSTNDVIIRLDSMILMSGAELPLRAIREMVASAIDLIVHTARLPDGSRKVIQIAEVAGMRDETHINIQDIFLFKQTGVDLEGNVVGYFTSTGYIPTFYDEIRSKGIELSREIFVPKD